MDIELKDTYVHALGAALDEVREKYTNAGKTDAAELVDDIKSSVCTALFRDDQFAGVDKYHESTGYCFDCKFGDRFRGPETDIPDTCKRCIRYNGK